MKHLLLLLLLTAAFTADAQKKQRLRDLLYGGRLRSDSGSVVRSTDDLTTKIDSGTRKPAPTVAPVTAAGEKPGTAPATTTPAPLPAQSTEAVVVMDSAASTLPTPTEPAADAEPAKPAAPKSNSRIWRDYTQALTAALKSETLTNKKIKKGDYYFIIDYELNTDGTITVGNISCSPENAILQSEVKTRLENEPPQLAPVLDSAGNPRKLKRKQSFVITKE